MWAPRYWNPYYWARRYWNSGASETPPFELHSDWARNVDTGEPAGGAVIAVQDRGTNALSTLYAPDGVTLQTNPFQADPDTGMYSWCAADGRYDETVIPLAGTGRPYTNADILLNVSGA